MESEKFYTKVLASDPGGELETALSAMKELKEITHPIKKVTFLMIADEVSVNVAWRLETALQIAIDASVMPRFAMAAMNGVGINVNDRQVTRMLDLLAEPLTDGDKVLIKDMGAVEVDAFPRLTAGELQRARSSI